METQVQTLQVISPLGEPTGVPNAVAVAHNATHSAVMPRVSQYEPLNPKVASDLEEIVKNSHSVRELVKKVDEAFPPVQTKDGFKYSKIADIAVAKFMTKFH